MRNQVKWYFISYKLIIKGLIQCSELEACKSGLFEPNIDFMSLTAENSFYCDRYYLKEWGIFTVLFSGCIISFIFVLLEDVFGKKRILLTSFFLFFFSGIFIFLIKSVYFKFAGFALLWAINQIFDITLLMLVNELTVGKKDCLPTFFWPRWYTFLDSSEIYWQSTLKVTKICICWYLQGIWSHTFCWHCWYQTLLCWCSIYVSLMSTETQ